MLRPEAYDHPVDDVRLIQTHISWVLLAGDYAYKIKRPVRFGFLDYSTLAKRRRMCQRELELNRRTCAGAYLDVVPIVADGAARFGGHGRVIEYAVKMRRLSPDGWLSDRIERGEAPVELLRGVAETVHAFHSSAATSDEIARFGSADQVSAIWRENIAEIAAFEGDTVSPEDLAELATFGETFLRINGRIIEERRTAGRVRDIHGDLRSDSIFISAEGDICLCDCIEFSDRLRCGDIAGDVAFLAMDLDFRGHPGLADEFAGAYARLAADDEALPFILPFYRVYRSIVRAKVESIAATDPEATDGDRASARSRAAGYFELAIRYVRDRTPPTLVVVGGLSGTGKSHIAAALAARLGAALIRSDAVRRLAFDAAGGDTALYEPDNRARVYELARQHARRYLEFGMPVVLDATHIERYERDAARTLAEECGLRTLLVWVSADEATIGSRLAARSGDLSDARWETYLSQRRLADPLAPDERADGTELDGTSAVTANIALIRERLGNLATSG